MLLALAGLSSAAMAQQKTEVVEYEIIQVQDKYQVITNPFWSNWWACGWSVCGRCASCPAAWSRRITPDR